MDAGTRRGAAPTTIRPTPPSFTAPTFVRALNQGGHLRFAKTHLRSILPTFVSTHDYSRLQCRELSTQSLPRLSRLYFHCRRVFARSCSDPTFPIGSIQSDTHSCGHVGRTAVQITIIVHWTATARHTLSAHTAPLRARVQRQHHVCMLRRLRGRVVATNIWISELSRYLHAPDDYLTPSG